MALHSAFIVLILSAAVQNTSAADSTQKGTCPPTSKSAITIPKRAKPPSPIPDVHYIGAVIMLVSLSDTGYVCDVTLVKGIEDRLDKQAIHFLRQQVFQPIRQDGKPIAGTMMVQRDYWRGNTSDTVYSENAGASTDEISGDARLFQALDIASVVASAKVDGAKYRNQYFGLSLITPSATATIPSATNDQGTTARLVDAVKDGPNRDDRYSISVVADRLSDHPELKSLEEYVGGITTQWRHEGAETTQDDFPYTISGVEFVGAILKIPDGPSTSHFRAILSTVMKGYLLSLDITAAKEQQILKIASTIEFDQGR